jgi:hypothetical protein
MTAISNRRKKRWKLGKIRRSKQAKLLRFASSQLTRTSGYSAHHRSPGSGKPALTNYEKELIAALEAGIHRWDILILYFEQKAPEVEIHGLPKMSGREFAKNLREKRVQYRQLIDRIKRG